MVEAGSLRWGRAIHRWRWLVFTGFGLLVLVSGWYGRDLGDHLTQEGWFDDSSQSVAASKLADDTFGRDRDGDLIAIYTAPAGMTVDDEPVRSAVAAELSRLRGAYPDRIARINSYFDGALMGQFADASRTHAFASIGLRGDGGTETVADYMAIKHEFHAGAPGSGPGGTTVQLAGMQPVVEGINTGMQDDIRRAELIALPLVAIVLYFVFGGVVAALLPVLIGGMTILGSQGLMRLLTNH
ncbi:MMPL family transporter, partial [Nocardia sp. NPDC004722]